MVGVVTPREVVERVIGLLADSQFAQAAELYADDCVIDVRFALPVPRIIEGIEAVRAFLETLDTVMYADISVQNQVVYETGDPEVVVAEWDYVGRRADGTPFENGNIIVTRVRDAKIVQSRDYHNHIAFAAAGGRLPGLLATLGQQV